MQCKPNDFHWLKRFHFHLRNGNVTIPFLSSFLLYRNHVYQVRNVQYDSGNDRNVEFKNRD